MRNDRGDIDITVNTVASGLTEPAWTTVGEDARIGVQIGAWYVNSASYGQLAGMLAHELGVHHATDQMMTEDEKMEEKEQMKSEQIVSLGERTYTIGAWQDNDNGSRQQDHVMAGRGGIITDDRLRLPVAGSTVRGQHYAQFVNRLCKAIASSNVLIEGKRHEAMKDLLDSYLFDHARFVVTDDHMSSVLTSPVKVAKGMNARGEAIRVDGTWGPWATNEHVNPRDAHAFTPYRILLGAGGRGVVEKTKQTLKKAQRFKGDCIFR
ncbi:hypothetical protein [Vibrio aquimaris]|uniref:hypothetical protein n=1 Tax=Vibrio aquimaris TaxID=2587862 RepID=UPI00126835EF|nr:hypothetical protein [Vibrio aquimaris]